MTRDVLRFAALFAVLTTVPTGVTDAVAQSVSGPAVTIRLDLSGLSSDEGTALVYERLRQAASSACTQLPVLDRWTESSRRACRGETLQVVIHRLNHPRSSAHHRACQRRARGSGC